MGESVDQRKGSFKNRFSRGHRLNKWTEKCYSFVACQRHLQKKGGRIEKKNETTVLHQKQSVPTNCYKLLKNTFILISKFCVNYTPALMSSLFSKQSCMRT